MVWVDAGVEDGDANAGAERGVPGTEGGAAGDVVAVAPGGEDGPTGGGVVEAVGCGWGGLDEDGGRGEAGRLRPEGWVMMSGCGGGEFRRGEEIDEGVARCTEEHVGGDVAVVEDCGDFRAAAECGGDRNFVLRRRCGGWRGRSARDGGRAGLRWRR